jgi:bifunctional N-acetylglucosamine-1-phosphate-uridyltransferase/glucosamine-1-phosphate-acetyltransferase GlmU-like protein
MFELETGRTIKYNYCQPLDAQLVIPMAGKSKRFFAVGYTKPKWLIDILDKSILGHIIKNNEFFSSILIIVNNEDLLNFNLDQLSELKHENIQVVGIEAHEKGPSYSILMAERYLKMDKKILVHYCDVFINWEIGKTISDLENADAIFLSFTGFHPTRLNGTTYAYAKLIDGSLNIIEDIREKQSFTKDYNEEQASTGVYGFSSGEFLLDSIKLQVLTSNHLNGEFYTSLTLGSIIKNGGKVLMQEVEVFYGWGTPTDLHDFVYYSQGIENLCSFTKKLTPMINHNAVLLAAGKSSRLRLKNKKPKQLKIVIDSLRLIDFSRFLVTNNSQVYLVAREEVYPSNLWDLPSKNIKLVPYGTESQLDSVIVGLSLISDLDKMISFLATDNIVICDKSNYFDFEIAEFDLLIWTSFDYPFAKKDPEKYSWVKINDSGAVEKVIRKARPPNYTEWCLVTGNFTFKSAEILNNLIDKISINNYEYGYELMLDDLLQIAIMLNLKIKTLEVLNFMTLGNEAEEDIFDYYMKLDHVSNKF